MNADPFSHIGGLTSIDLATLDVHVQDLLTRLTTGPTPDRVHELFPYPYTAYLRIFPRIQVAGTGTAGETHWRWQHLAELRDEHVSATVSISRLLEQLHDELVARDIRVEPYIGQLDRVTTVALAQILQQVSPTATQSYFYIRSHSGLGTAPAYLYRGSANLIEHFYVGQPPLLETPTMWWAEDGSWCVTTPQDSPTAYMGGSDMAVQAILQDDRIERYAAAGTDLVDDWFAK